MIAVPLSVLCEFVWVLSKGYKLSASDITDAIRGLIDSETVVLNRQAAETGLAMLAAGGDFADGIIAHEGRWLGSDSFLTFDKKAVKLLQAQGIPARLLA